ncbi:hypothetical protein B0H67DRAFT_233629 [Lasiosphaeris hirsuta]|uniref:Uncharacterized protein n=1 Tax=Lasiosphaeris hirsuta TaxID=260670 RepID=A0AA40AFV3_9PEZI|nr:hypothetical protein B0H67DRAFT_233629 [Lasiosphaeris hirsuta]
MLMLWNGVGNIGISLLHMLETIPIPRLKIVQVLGRTPEDEMAHNSEELARAQSRQGVFSSCLLPSSFRPRQTENPRFSKTLKANKHFDISQLATTQTVPAPFTIVFSRFDEIDQRLATSSALRQEIALRARSRYDDHNSADRDAQPTQALDLPVFRSSHLAPGLICRVRALGSGLLAPAHRHRQTLGSLTKHHTNTSRHAVGASSHSMPAMSAGDRSKCSASPSSTPGQWVRSMLLFRCISSHPKPSFLLTYLHDPLAPALFTEIPSQWGLSNGWNPSPVCEPVALVTNPPDFRSVQLPGLNCLG